MYHKQNKSPIIIGGGPAGIACALQLQRYGLNPLLLEKHELGGLLWNANLVENYPGFPNGVRGEKLIGLMKKQIERIGVEVRREEVLQVDWNENCFLVKTNFALHTARYLVIATGTKSRPLPDVIAHEARGRVYTEVWPLMQQAGKQIIIVGAGDAAFDYALSLSKKRNFVTILNRGENVKCLPLLFERAMREPRVSYRAGIAVRRITLQETASRLRVESEAETFEADYVLFAIGRIPNLDFLSEKFHRQKMEWVESGRLYFIGDVKNELYRQVVIAAGDGLRAAMHIYTRLKNEIDCENR